MLVGYAKARKFEEQDYKRINKILDEVEIRAMQEMATGWIAGERPGEPHGSKDCDESCG